MTCGAWILRADALQTAGRVFKIKNLSDVEATLLEPASCAAHGLDKIAPKMGSSVLMFGAGPTGLVGRARSSLFDE
jgi:threonine dehydrogenase-like Zn-dependent dehydrogenase